MASKSSSEPAHPAPHAVHHEWRTAQNSASYLLPKINSMSEQNSKLKLLDVGAGSGSISATLAQLIPDGHITAIDINPDILPLARAVAEMVGVTNINFEQGDAHKLSYADESFDITICHQILFHLKEPWIVLREMMGVTKAGGIVGAREGDLDTECIWPELPGLLSFHNFAASMMKDGGTSTAGRQLLVDNCCRGLSKRVWLEKISP
ncbi:hypothetical protein HYALB_00010565 [Hymenoscyphus albidus]|uniref:Methyltransferase domain-containing protein n=1 Tax=Hymenoscyphus albidus TaxID=595503 RepID=A0A9N9Q1B1_9HELO|nr:hypothetical protein HYALB_00010565 [Hymenoscyphus albidus]